MSVEFKVPELGEGVDTAEVSQIYVSEGDTIDADQGVMELETEKAVADLPCPHAGTIAKIHVSKGETIKVGQTVLTLEDQEPSSKEEEEAAEHADDESQEDEPASETDEEKDEGTDEGKEEQQQKETPSDEQKSDEAQTAKKKEQEKKKEKKAKETEKEAEKKASAEEEAPPRDEEEEKETEEPVTEEEPSAEQSEAGPATEEEGDEKAEKDEMPKAGMESEETDEAEKEEPAEKTEDKPEELPPSAGPATRRLARKLDVDLHDVEGSGSGGRITQEDVVKTHDRSRPAAAAAGRIPQPPLPDFTKYGQVKRQPLNKIARTAMKNLGTSWAVVPHVTQHDLADITDLESARRRYLADSDESDPKITLTAIAVKAAVAVLKQFPHFNASLDTEKEELILKEYYHIGVAVDTERGLLVPVLRDADQKSVIELAAELADVAERARLEKLSLKDMEGATFTISNQGGIGGTAFTPIVNFPQVAILGMSRARPEVQLNDGHPQERLMLPLSLSYDHRAINGADAARFLVRLSEELSDCFQLLIRA